MTEDFLVENEIELWTSPDPRNTCNASGGLMFIKHFQGFKDQKCNIDCGCGFDFQYFLKGLIQLSIIIFYFLC